MESVRLTVVCDSCSQCGWQLNYVVSEAGSCVCVCVCVIHVVSETGS